MTGLWTCPRGQVNNDDFCTMVVSLHLKPRRKHISTCIQESMKRVFANQDDEDAIYPLTTREIAEAQKPYPDFNATADKHDYTTQLVENTKVLCKTGKMIIPKSLQQHAVAWYHHYLQHPRNTCLEETLCLSMYWKGLGKTVQSHVKNVIVVR